MAGRPPHFGSWSAGTSLPKAGFTLRPRNTRYPADQGKRASKNSHAPRTSRSTAAISWLKGLSIISVIRAGEAQTVSGGGLGGSGSGVAACGAGACVSARQRLIPARPRPTPTISPTSQRAVTRCFGVGRISLRARTAAMMASCRSGGGGVRGLLVRSRSSRSLIFVKSVSAACLRAWV